MRQGEDQAREVRNPRVLTRIQEALQSDEAATVGPAEAIYDELFKRGMLRLDAFEAR